MNTMIDDLLEQCWVALEEEPKDLDQAIKLAEQATIIDPSYADAFHLLGRAYMKRWCKSKDKYDFTDKDAAITSFQKSKELYSTIIDDERKKL